MLCRPGEYLNLIAAETCAELLRVAGHSFDAIALLPSRELLRCCGEGTDDQAPGDKYARP